MQIEIEPTVVAAIVGAMITLGLAFLGWLNHKFNTIDETAKSIEKITSLAMSTHELQDQRRHEENLLRFERISVALARLGSTNGLPH